MKTYHTDRRVRVRFGGVTIADTTSALYVWEHGAYPYFYLPSESFLTTFDHKKSSSALEWKELEKVPGQKQDVGARVYSMTAKIFDGSSDKGSSKESSTDRVLGFEEGELKHWVKIEFDAIDQWLEEDTPIQVHPKDPFKRIDLLHSTRTITVTIPRPSNFPPAKSAKPGDVPQTIDTASNIILAHAPYSIHLLETGLPTRYYLPATSITRFAEDTALPFELRDTPTRTKCPYKGEAEYYDIVFSPGTAESSGDDRFTLKDIIWYYTNTTLEVGTIAGLRCFYGEKVDIWIDGKKIYRPKTWFS